MEKTSLQEGSLSGMFIDAGTIVKGLAHETTLRQAEGVSTLCRVDILPLWVTGCATPGGTARLRKCATI